MNALAILGAGGHGKVVAETAELQGWEKIAFFDDAYPKKQSTGKWSIQGSGSDLILAQSQFDFIHVAIGENHLRNQKIQMLDQSKLTSIVHPTANISPSAKIEKGAAIFSNATVNADVTVGTGSILNSGSIVEHDCNLVKFVHICPGATLGGNVVIGENSLIGINASVIPNILIGKNVVIGAGSAVISDIPNFSVAAGVPCQIIRMVK